MPGGVGRRNSLFSEVLRRVGGLELGCAAGGLAGGIFVTAGWSCKLAASPLLPCVVLAAPVPPPLLILFIARPSSAVVFVWLCPSDALLR